MKILGAYRHSTECFASSLGSWPLYRSPDVCHFRYHVSMVAPMTASRRVREPRFQGSGSRPRCVWPRDAVVASSSFCKERSPASICDPAVPTSSWGMRSGEQPGDRVKTSLGYIDLFPSPCRGGFLSDAYSSPTVLAYFQHPCSK